MFNNTSCDTLGAQSPLEPIAAEEIITTSMDKESLRTHIMMTYRGTEIYHIFAGQMSALHFIVLQLETNGSASFTQTYESWMSRLGLHLTTDDQGTPNIRQTEVFTDAWRFVVQALNHAEDQAA